VRVKKITRDRQTRRSPSSHSLAPSRSRTVSAFGRILVRPTNVRARRRSALAFKFSKERKDRIAFTTTTGLRIEVRCGRFRRGKETTYLHKRIKREMIFLCSLVRAYGCSRGGKDIRNRDTAEKRAALYIAQSQRVESHRRLLKRLSQRRNGEPRNRENDLRTIGRSTRPGRCDHSGITGSHGSCRGSISIQASLLIRPSFLFLGNAESRARRALLRRERPIDFQFIDRLPIISCHGQRKIAWDTQREWLRRLSRCWNHSWDSRRSKRERMHLARFKDRCAFIEIFRRGSANAYGTLR